MRSWNKAGKKSFSPSDRLPRTTRRKFPSRFLLKKTFDFAEHKEKPRCGLRAKTNFDKRVEVMQAKVLILYIRQQVL